MRANFIRWLLVLLWMGVIFWGSASPNPYQVLPDGWTGRCAQIIAWERLARAVCQNEFGGNLSHILEYAILGYLINQALAPQVRGENLNLSEQKTIGFANSFFALGATILFGISDEIHQVFIPERTFQFFDLGLDLIGAALGILLYRMVIKRKKIVLLS